MIIFYPPEVFRSNVMKIKPLGHAVDAVVLDDDEIQKPRGSGIDCFLIYQFQKKFAEYS